MWDVNSGKSRGYGFVAFRDKAVSIILYVYVIFF